MFWDAKPSADHPQNHYVVQKHRCMALHLKIGTTFIVSTMIKTLNKNTEALCCWYLPWMVIKCYQYISINHDYCQCSTKMSVQPFQLSDTNISSLIYTMNIDSYLPWHRSCTLMYYPSLYDISIYTYLYIEMLYVYIHHISYIYI